MKINADCAMEGVSLLNHALDLARRLDVPDTFFHIVGNWLFFVEVPQNAAEQLQLADELIARSRAGVSIPILAWALMYAGGAFASLGQRERAEEVFHELQDLAKRTQGANYLIWSMGIDATVATWDGHLWEAVEMTQDIITRGQELDLTEFAPVIASLYGTRPRLYLGRGVKAYEHAYQNSLREDEPISAIRCLIMAHLGRIAQVEEILQQRVVARPGIGSVDDKTSASDDIILLETAVLVGHRQSAELLLKRLAGSGFHTTKLHTTCTARHLGGAAAFLNRPEEARNHYKEAIKVCTEMRFRPELALTRLQLAELLLEHYPDEKSDALEHLDFAINEFREMKMQPSLERALRHKEILGA